MTTVVHQGAVPTGSTGSSAGAICGRIGLYLVAAAALGFCMWHLQAGLVGYFMAEFALLYLILSYEKDRKTIVRDPGLGVLQLGIYGGDAHLTEHLCNLAIAEVSYSKGGRPRRLLVSSAKRDKCLNELNALSNTRIDESVKKVITKWIQDLDGDKALEELNYSATGIQEGYARFLWRIVGYFVLSSIVGLALVPSSGILALWIGTTLVFGLLSLDLMVQNILAWRKNRRHDSQPRVIELGDTVGIDVLRALADAELDLNTSNQDSSLKVSRKQLKKCWENLHTLRAEIESNAECDRRDEKLALIQSWINDVLSGMDPDRRAKINALDDQLNSEYNAEVFDAIENDDL